MIPITSNYSKRDLVRYFVATSFGVLVLVGFVLFAVDNYLIPFLKGWEMLMDKMLDKNDGLFFSMIDKEINDVVNEANTIDVNSLTADELESELQLLVDTSTESIMQKYWGLLLVLITPLVAIPVLFWLAIKAIMWVTDKIMIVTKIYPKDCPPLEFYWKGNLIGKKKNHILNKS